jgi:hypothetical protein
MLEATAAVSEGLFNWNLNVLCTVILIAISAAAGFVTVLMWHSLVLSITASRAVAYGVALSFACANAFLAYMRSGSSYVLGLFFVTLSVWILWRAAQRNTLGRGVAWAGGLSLAAGVLFWLPYVLSLPGVAFLGIRRQALAGGLRDWWSRANRVFAGHFLGMFFISIMLCYGFALAARGIHSVAEARVWAAESSHGWSQSRNILRIVTGLPRSFFYMGNDGVLYKRFLWKDPYDPVSLPRLLRASLWKLAVFYLFAAALLLELMVHSRNHSALAILLAGAAPTIGFAIFVFEPGSPERYFPIYPFLILAIAKVLGDFPTSRRLTQGVILASLTGMLATNVYCMYRPRIAMQDITSAQRVAPLKQRLRDGDLVAVLNNHDSLYLFANRSPFDPINRPNPLRLYDVIEPANTRVLRWRQEFAKRALRAWDQGDEVWVSKRLWAGKPLPDWQWVEGDDGRVSWTDIPQFFRQFEIAQDLGGPDGFLRLTPTDHNITQLKSAGGRPRSSRFWAYWQTIPPGPRSKRSAMRPSWRGWRSSRRFSLKCRSDILMS